MLLSKLESVQGGMFFLIDLKQRPLKHSVLTTNVWTNTWGRSKENGNTPPKPSPHGGIAQFGIQRHRTLRMGGGLTQQPWILPHSLWQLKENLILVKFNFAYAVINLKKKINCQRNWETFSLLKRHADIFKTGYCFALT